MIQNGGTLVLTDLGDRDVRLLFNSLFNVELLSGCSSSSLQYNKAGDLSPSSLLYDGPDTVEHFGDMTEVCGSSLPTSAVPVYQSAASQTGNDTSVVVMEMPYGSGRVVGLAYSWLVGRPSAGGWSELLRLAARPA